MASFFEVFLLSWWWSTRLTKFLFVLMFHDFHVSATQPPGNQHRLKGREIPRKFIFQKALSMSLLSKTLAFYSRSNVDSSEKCTLGGPCFFNSNPPFRTIRNSYFLWRTCLKQEGKKTFENLFFPAKMGLNLGEPSTRTVHALPYLHTQ